MDKSCSGCSRHIAGQGISAALFLQTGPQAVLPRMGAKHQRPLLRLPGLRSFHERQQPAEEDSENTNLPVLLRDDTICGVDGIVRVRREGIVRMAQHCACSLKSAMILLLRRHNICPRGSTAMLVCSTPGKWHACLKAGCSSQAAASFAVTLPFSWRALA